MGAFSADRASRDSDIRYADDRRWVRTWREIRSDGGNDGRSPYRDGGVFDRVVGRMKQWFVEAF